MHQQQRGSGGVQYFVGHAAERPALDPTVTVGGHHNQVDRLALCLIDYRFGGMAIGHARYDRQARSRSMAA